RTYEADCFDAWLGQDRTDGFFIAMHNIEHAIRKPGLLKSFHNPINCRRILFTLLQNNHVAAYQSGRDHPQRNHRREVEWDDACAKFSHFTWCSSRVHDSTFSRPRMISPSPSSSS